MSVNDEIYFIGVVKQALDDELDHLSWLEKVPLQDDAKAKFIERSERTIAIYEEVIERLGRA